MEKYDFKSVEKKWQEYWEKHGTFRASDFQIEKPKYFPLIEFPYPSGAGLHVGHPRPYTALDVIARKRRMQGYNVLYPIGWDAFGLPTENYAIKTGRPPAEVTAENIATFKRQIQSLGISFDWSREVDTTDPKYYKWTQWIFLQLFKHGLAYKQNMPINWCLNCKIGLANEEVVDGKCERCGGPVEKRDKEQWMLAITKYADRLLEDLDTVDYIPQAKTQQTNWIGKSEGAEIDFGVKDSEAKIRIFTTRPDTIFGATYMVLAPEHSLLDTLKDRIENWDEVHAYRSAARLMKDIDRSAEGREKTGVQVEGVMAVNPANKEEIPVFIADYVLGSYGTGAIMAVPAHDERDWEFAVKYEIPVRQVVRKVDAPIRSYVMGAETITEKDFFSISVVIAGKTADGFYKVEIPRGRERDFESLITEKMAPGYWNEYIGAETVFLFKHKNGEVERLVLNDENIARIDQLACEFNDQTFVPSDPGNYINGALARNSWYHPLIVHTEQGVLMNSGTFDGFDSEEAKWKITEALGGTKTVKYKLRDWVFSRQRYWGEPIPLVWCDNCGGWVPLPEDQLPLELPKVEKYEPTDTGESPLAAMTDWVNTTCPACGGPAKRETDTMPNWAGSSWYFLRYLAPHDDVFFTKPKPWKRPVVEPNEHDQAVWQTFLTLRQTFKKENIDFWICGSLLMNALNRGLWVHMDDLDVHVHGRDYERAIAALESAGMAINKRRDGSIEITHGEVDIELVEVVADNGHEYSYYSNGQRVLMTMNDLERVERGQLFGVTFRTVSPWHAIFQYTYLQKYFEREKEGDEEKKKFLRAYLNDPVNYWMGVDWYNGGMEHTVLHLLYSRFWNKFLFDIEASPVSEPYNKRTSHGLILAKGGEKMSKSKGNVVNPDEIVGQFGADTFRTYEMFMGPFDQHAQWDTNGLIGVHRFLEKVWRLSDKVVADEETTVANDVTQKVHMTIKKVHEDIERMGFNTAIAALMELTNKLGEQEKVSLGHYRILLRLLAPFAPHIAEELWSLHGNKDGSIACAQWPEADPAQLQLTQVTYAVQVNGKLRATLEIAADASEDEVRMQTLALPTIQKWLGGKEPKKVIIVKGKMVSVVI